MDNYVYGILFRYFQTLSKTGYVSYETQQKMLFLLFYYHMFTEYFVACGDEKDASVVSKALQCLFGSSCLFTYPKAGIFMPHGSCAQGVRSSGVFDSWQHSTGNYSLHQVQLTNGKVTDLNSSDLIKLQKDGKYEKAVLVNTLQQEILGIGSEIMEGLTTEELNRYIPTMSYVQEVVGNTGGNIDIGRIRELDIDYMMKN